MNAMSWNVRGIRTSLNRLKILVRNHHLHLLVVIDSKQQSHKLDFYRLTLGFSNAISSTDGNIWILWMSSMLHRDTIYNGVQHISIRFQWIPTGTYFWWSAVSGKHTVSLLLWADLTTFAQDVVDPWLVGGDLNTFLSIDEHKDHSTPSLRQLSDFNNWVQGSALLEVPYQGSKFTWSDGQGLGRVWRRLDRILVKESFYDQFGNQMVQHLTRTTSDHAPLLLSCRQSTNNGPRFFLFSGYMVISF